MKRITIILFLLLSIQLNARDVVIGVYDMYPACFRDTDGNVKGIYIDVFNAMAKKYNWQVQFYFSTFNDVYKKLRDGELDLVPGLVRTDERAIFLDFSAKSILQSAPSFDHNKKYQIKSVKDLNNLRVGLIKGDVNNEKFIKLCLDNNVTPRFIYYDDFAELLLHIKYDSVVGGIFKNFYRRNYDDLQGLIVESPIKFATVTAHICTKKGTNSDLLLIINQQIGDWKEDKNSIFYDILDYWIYQRKVKHDSSNQGLIISIVAISLVIALGLVAYFKLKRK